MGALIGVNVSPVAQQSLAASISGLLVDWSNTFTHERATDLTEELKRIGVNVRVQQFTGDSSFPTEHTISHGATFATGPTFDFALMAFLVRLLQEKSHANNNAG
jgi:predicted amino acid-binding ACT domain protein